MIGFLSPYEIIWHCWQGKVSCVKPKSWAQQLLFPSSLTLRLWEAEVWGEGGRCGEVAVEDSKSRDSSLFSSQLKGGESGLSSLLGWLLLRPPFFLYSEELWVLDILYSVRYVLETAYTRKREKQRHVVGRGVKFTLSIYTLEMGKHYKLGLDLLLYWKMLIIQIRFKSVTWVHFSSQRDSY